VLSEGLIVHKEVDHITFSGFEPREELVRGQRPVLPSLVGETESDVVAELIVTQQELKTRLDWIGIDIVRALPTKNVAGAFGQHGLETKSINLLANVVGIDQLGVPEGFRGHSEMVLDSLDMLLHLMLELSFIGEGSQGVVICLGEELDLTSVGQLLETPHDLRLIAVELLESGSGDGEGDLEIFTILFDEIQKQLVHREIALVGDSVENGPVGEIVVIVGVLADVEETVQPQPGRLVDLEI
jgi:hypothetical protein